MKRFEEISWSDAFLGLLMVVCIAIGVVLQVAISADHRPKLYYIEKLGNDDVPCVKAWQEWIPNAHIYCSDDVNKLLTVMDRMNESLSKSRGH